jgi:hypothetical protein
VSVQAVDGRNSKSANLQVIGGAFLTLILVIVCLLTFGQAGLFAQSEPTPLSFTEYVAQLTAAAQALETGSDLADVQEELAAIEAVRLSNGEVLSLEPLLADAPNREAALVRLQTVLAQLEASANDRAGERIHQLNTLIDLLALDRPSLWQRILQWIDDFMQALLPEEMPRGANTVAEIGSRILVWTIVIIGVILVATLLSYWFRHLFGGILRDIVLRRRQGDELIPETADEARQQAQSFAQAGNYRQAVRQLYFSALLHLDEQGLLRFERDQTNREVLAQVKWDTPVGSHLAPVMATFDRVWYGIREPDQQTFEAYRQEIELLLAQTGDQDRA